MSEQIADMNKMGSHTSRYASINAQWYELTGDAAARREGVSIVQLGDVYVR